MHLHGKDHNKSHYFFKYQSLKSKVTKWENPILIFHKNLLKILYIVNRFFFLDNTFIKERHKINNFNIKIYINLKFVKSRSQWCLSFLGASIIGNMLKNNWKIKLVQIPHWLGSILESLVFALKKLFGKRHLTFFFLSITIFKQRLQTSANNTWPKYPLLFRFHLSALVQIGGTVLKKKSCWNSLYFSYPSNHKIPKTINTDQQQLHFSQFTNGWR